MLEELKLIADGLENLIVFLIKVDPVLKNNKIVLDLQKALEALKALGI